MKYRFALVAAVFFATAALAPAAPITAEETDMAAEAGATHEKAIDPAKIPQSVVNAVNSPDRPAADKQLDPGRKPQQMLAFFGIEPGMKVGDLWASGGYTTELLARAVAPSGEVFSQNGEAEDAWKARLKEPGMSNLVELQKPFTKPGDILPVPPDSLDAVICNMNYHDMVGFGYDTAKINAAVLNSLKPGGIYGIIDNSAAPGSDARDVSTLHRIDEAYEVNQIKSAGFVLVAASDALRNPKDDRSWLVFQHRGEQDRFMLKFIKPQGAGGAANK
jgi:predicted methyltransferase